jgi:hypothetical protein
MGGGVGLLEASVSTEAELEFAASAVEAAGVAVRAPASFAVEAHADVASNKTSRAE